MVLCFKLETCSNMPEHMWLTCDAIITATISICWKLFASFLVIRLLKDGIDDLANGKVDLRTHASTLIKATCIGIFLLYYKEILSLFDNFINMFCVSVAEGSEHVIYDIGKDTFMDPNVFSWKKLVNKLLFTIPDLISVLSHTGLIGFVYYFRSISLFIAIAMGPFAALMSLLPGPFKHGWTTWSRTYATISCWAITLNLFKIMSTMLREKAVLIDYESSDHLFQGVASSTGLNIALWIAIWGTPLWTAIFIGHAITPINLLAAMRNVDDWRNKAKAVFKMGK